MARTCLCNVIMKRDVEIYLRQKVNLHFSVSNISLLILITSNLNTTLSLGPPGVLGIWGEGLFIFRELGSTANYFRGAGEQVHTFGDLGSTAKK